MRRSKRGAAPLVLLHRWSVPCVLLVAVVVSRAAKAQQLKPEEAAAQLIASANKAYDEKQFPFATERFRQYLKDFGGQKDANLARYGLGLCLLEAPQKDFKVAVETLTPVVGVADFPHRASALYYLALAYRGQGYDALAQGIAKPNEAPQHQATANGHFTQALKFYGDAAAAFAALVKTPEKAELSPDSEWAARARCDQAEMLLQLGKPKEAAEAVALFTADPLWSKSRFRPQALYYQGQASFLLKDYNAAGRALGQLAPFNDPVFGIHVQYLLARTHHLSDEHPEAKQLYEAVVTGYDKQKVTATQSLANAALWVDKPEEKARVEQFVKAPPDYVNRASFYWGVLLYEEQKYTDALVRFTPLAALPAQNPPLPLTAEAQLRQGMCHVQLKAAGEALKVLQPLSQHPTLGDRALLWLARAQIAAADPNQPQPYEQAVNNAIANFKSGVDKTQPILSTDPGAKARRTELLLEMGDAQQAIKQYANAAATYLQLLNENNVPERTEEILQRQAAALHLAGKYDESDAACQRFQQNYALSTLLPAILFRSAENAYVRGAAIDPGKATVPNAEVVKWMGEAIKRYQVVIEKHPEFQHVPLARYRMALAHYRLGEYPLALTILTAIAPADRQGEIAAASYHQADCLLRTMPASTAGDALATARQLQTLGEAIKLLDGYLGVQPASPHSPDALLKFGYCHRQVAEQMVNPNEKNQTLATARAAFEKVTTQFAAHPLAPVAIFERAKCLSDAGDVNGAINEFNRFKADPLKNAPVAPLAWLRASALLRSQKKPQEAVDLLALCRTTYEGPLAADPTRADWIPLIQYHHGLAVRETGKLPEARAIFESISQKFPARPEGPEAAWRAGQCRREEALPKLEAAQKLLAKPDAKPEELTAGNAQLAECVKSLTDAGKYFTDQAGQLAQKAAGSETHQRLLYEAAWCYQTLTDLEIAAARKKLADEALKKLQEQLAKQGPGVPGVPQVRTPEIPVTSVPLQPSEQLARAQYAALIGAAAEAPLANLSRLELAEMHARRDDHDPAIKLLNDALDREPPPELEERIRLRFGASLTAKNDHKGAFLQFASIAQNLKSPLAPEAKLRAGESLMQQQDWPKAIEQLVVFRDKPEFQNAPGVADRALLRLAQALGQATQWEPSRQACELLINRFPQSPLKQEARYGMAFAWQNLKQFDQAANTYTQVTNETSTEVAAKAQLQLALCRVEQKRLPEATTALLVVPYTYDYPQWSSAALLEAARLLVEQQQPKQAAKLLEKVIKDYPETEWAKAAQTRLTDLQAGKKI